MFDDITGDELIAQILMEHVGRFADDASIRYCYLVVEGADDMRLLQSYVNKNVVSIVPGGGKSSVLNCLAAKDNEGMSVHVVGLVDRDGDQTPGHSGNLVRTDYYDLDAEILAHSNVLDRVYINHCAKSKIETFIVGALRMRVHSMLRDFSLLRIASKREGWDLAFRKLSLQNLYDSVVGDIDRRKLIGKLAENSAEIHASQIEDLLNRELAETGDWSRMVSGHDIAKAYALLLREEGGVSFKPELVEKMFRSALWPHEFINTPVFTLLSAWATDNDIDFWAAVA
ncbi:hypothetical protein HQ312_14925 [Rhodococcus sp. BP-316]|uniref:DUF4435 domain-containing protein n=1 Tax=Rhodococcus sp. BP-316 TaxID=2739445 RepID=UPI001C9B85F2|nr:DUF4435 domain-containing protein [Rhodococcus sp. BP-316]MBY6682347.1 hypothetical protein [Rhodococcus sp. BP-316]